MKTSRELRASFLDFFGKRDHQIIKSAPLIPQDDPTLLFVNAGMVPFKNIFTGLVKKDFQKCTSSQKCVRAGGKHNDLENVGYTSRHHTFFEMLGNFSFGDYFKEGAIKMAWEYLTKVIMLDANKLNVTIFAGDENAPEDTEAFDIWQNVIGLPKSKIVKMGAKDNFWQMGDTGPCGPCTEIHYETKDQNLEIWNIVFMQFNRTQEGILQPLPNKCVDTGMGLERLTCVVNGYNSNYETDLFNPLIQKTAVLSQKNYKNSSSEDDVSMRVIADHARATSFLIADGLFPGNEGRSYVLRRIMRRAIRHGHKLGLNKLFFGQVCGEVVEQMGSIYPELCDAQKNIESIVSMEEENFRRTLDRGMQLFKEQADKAKKKILPGDVVFKLHDTYGFPPDLTENLANENNLTIDWQQFELLKKEHEELSSKGLGLSSIPQVFTTVASKIGKTEFQDANNLNECKLLSIIKGEKEVDSLSQGEEGYLVFDKTNFYGESGGQVGDTGYFKKNGVNSIVMDTKKYQGVNFHKIILKEGKLSLGEILSGQIDSKRREMIRKNHSATHLLHSALRNILGDHVTQKGSLVLHTHLRFDFSHTKALTTEQILAVEKLVNDWIMANEEAKTKIMSIEEAKQEGALALFGEKYEENVRVLDMGSHSRELCGGTHCERTGDIGFFKIVSEGPVALGIRRIEAKTGEGSLNYINDIETILSKASLLLSSSQKEIVERISSLQEENKQLKASLKSHAQSNMSVIAKKLQQKAQAIDENTSLIVYDASLDIDKDDIKELSDAIRAESQSCIVVLGYFIKESGQCSILVSLTKDLVAKYHAGKILQKLLPIVEGKGGGRPDFAQGGGKKGEKLSELLVQVKDCL